MMCSPQRRVLGLARSIRVRAGYAAGLFGLATLLATPSATVHAQGTVSAATASWRLVRCRAERVAACLDTRLTLSPSSRLTSTRGSMTWRADLAGVGMVGPDQRDVNGAAQSTLTPVFGAPVLSGSSLARTVLHGTLILVATGDTAARANAAAALQVPVTWRPPLIAMPVYAAVADSAALPSAVRDALDTGDDPASVRGVVLLLLVACGALLVMFVPRFTWTDYRETEEDLARQVAAARALLSTQELEELRGKAPSEAKPRSPDESTRETIISPRPRR